MKRMKRLVAIAICSVVAGSAFAGDVYALRLSCKTPVIKQAATYYKDFTSTTYNGYVNIEYDTNGVIVNPCEAILYGRFADGNGIRNATLDLSVLNVFGKTQNKVEISAECDLDSIALVLAGTGKCKNTRVDGIDPCGDAVACAESIRLDNITGNFTGLITDVLCDPCGDSSWTWEFNTCISSLLIPGDIDVVYGSWSMKYSKALTRVCAEEGFPESVMSKIPKVYLPAE